MPNDNSSTIQELLASPTLLTDMPHTTRLSDRAKRIMDGHLRYQIYHPLLAPIPAEAARFCDDVLSNRPPRWLSILGPSGIGKTFINRQICRRLGDWWKVTTETGRRRPWIAEIVPASDLGDYKASRDYAKADLVFVEDIGAGSGEKGPGAVTRSRIAELLQLRSGKWTLLDANLYRAEVAELIDPRIASRLKRDGSVLIELPADVPDFNG